MKIILGVNSYDAAKQLCNFLSAQGYLAIVSSPAPDEWEVIVKRGRENVKA